MDQISNTSHTENTNTTYNKEKSLKEIFNERELTIEELNNISDSVKKDLLKSLGYNPRTTAYLQPRSSQIHECNNSDVGDGLLRRFIFNINKIIYSLNKDSIISEPPKSF